MADSPDAKTRILVVDDSKVMRKAAVRMLGDEFDVMTADDGAQGWKALEADDSIRIVFSDLSMPVMDGYAFLRKVRTAPDEGLQGLPVIIVTGAENDDAARERALDLGATDFITKPFNSTDLLARARAHAHYQRLARTLREQATVDALTSLLNRNGFMERLKQDISFARRHQQPITLVRMDFVDFKKIFLQYGKVVADDLLVRVAAVIRERIRKEDSAARVGLSGFAISLPAGEHAGVKGVAEHVRRQVMDLGVKVSGRPLEYRFCGGVLTPGFHPGLTALSAMEECQRVLDAAIKSGKSLVLGDSDVLKARGVAAEVLLPSQAVPPPKSEPPAAQVRIDDLLLLIQSGESAKAQEVMPQALKKLLPLLKLATTRQREQLVKFLQQQGG